MYFRNRECIMIVIKIMFKIKHIFSSQIASIVTITKNFYFFNILNIKSIDLISGLRRSQSISEKIDQFFKELSSKFPNQFSNKLT